MNSTEEYKDHIPPAVYAAAEKLFSEALKDPCRVHDPAIVSGWTLETYAVEYVCPKGKIPDVMSLIVEQTAYEELRNKLEEIEEDPEIFHSAFILGAPNEGAFVLVKPPNRWWVAEPLEKMIGEGQLTDYSYGNDSCPSLGAELLDGNVIQIYTGHPNPDHHTRHDGCDPRFVIYVYDPNGSDIPGDVVWSGENEEAAAREVVKLIKQHGGVRRELRRLP